VKKFAEPVGSNLPLRRFKAGAVLYTGADLLAFGDRLAGEGSGGPVAEVEVGDPCGLLAGVLVGPDAKKFFYPSRGLPQRWELKSAEIIKPGPWKRAKNRRFCDELVRLLTTMGATTYAATIDKNNMKHAMTL
jgi:hypothetical protein